MKRLPNKFIYNLWIFFSPLIPKKNVLVWQKKLSCFINDFVQAFYLRRQHTLLIGTKTKFEFVSLFFYIINIVILLLIINLSLPSFFK